MTFDVKVSGVPANVKLGKLIPLFSEILSMKSNEFLLRLLPSNGPVKEVLLCLPTFLGAQIAQQKIDDYVFKYNNGTYVFGATLEAYKPNNKKFKQKPKFQHQSARQSFGYQNDNQCEDEYSSDTSRNPHLEVTAQLDMQIEILRKQRLILEEERKLLEEQRKLEQLKMESFNNKTALFTDTIYDEDAKMSGPSINPSQSKSETKQLSFHQASGVLMKKMNIFINKHSSPEERKPFVAHLRSILKKRLATVVAADNQGIWQTHKVIKLYRSQYPALEDEELVKEALKNVREGCQTAKIETVEASDKGANANNKPGGTKSAAGDHTRQGNATEGDLKVEKKFEEKRLFFHKASGVLIRKMNKHVVKHAAQNTRRLLVEYLRSTLKQRLAAVIAGQPIYQTFKIIKMYRAVHPDSEDEDLVKQLLKDIEEGRVTEESLITDEDKEADTDNSPSDKNSVSLEKNNITAEGSTNESSPPDNTKNIDASPSTIERNVERKVDEKEEILQKHMEYQTTEKDTSVLSTENVTNLENTQTHDSKVENDLQSELVGDNVEKNSEEPEMVENNANANEFVRDDTEKAIYPEMVEMKSDNNLKTEDVVTEAYNNLYGDLINLEEDNRGIKRKNEKAEEGCVKVPKIDEKDL